MKTDEHLDDLMVQWGQARAGGEALAAEALCHDCPELLQPLRERLTILEAMSWLDEVNKHQPGDDTLPAPSTLLPEVGRKYELPDLAMPPETLREKLVNAGVLTAEEIQLPLSATDAEEPLTCERIADVLMRQGKLTPFQLRRVVEGRGEELVMGSYLLLDEIGAGGMGRVYRARHRRMKRVVALKVLAADAVNEPALQRFHREVEAMARLDHPNIVTSHDAAESGGRHFLVMQYVDGDDLARLVARRGPLTSGQALDCLLQAARGLECAHQKGIIHRDIKPSNLMLDRSGVVKVLDLGLARLVKAAQPGAEAGSDFTEEQVVMGTADYMAPEQALDTHRADQKSDIYSLGCTLHFLLTGRPVYGAATLMGRMIAHRELPIPSLRERNPEVPDYLEAVFQKMVAKNPDERYPSMTALLQELDGHANPTEKLHLDAESATFLPPGMLVDTSSIACRDTLCQEKPAAPPPRPRTRRSRPIAVLAVALGVIAVVVGLLVSGIFRVQTPDGTIVVELEGKPIPVQVNADGTITITDPNDGKKIEVNVEKGKKLLTLTKDGFQAIALEFNLSTKDGRRLTARFEPNADPAGLDQRQILFVSQRTGNSEIFSMNLDGTGVKNLTNHSATDEYPVWSPDGKRIAFSSDRGGAFNVYTMDANGQNVKQLTHGQSARLPTWSPDGKRVLYTDAVGKYAQLFVVDVHAGTTKQLTGIKVEQEDGTDPAWSPDGNKIAFASRRSGTGYGVYVMDADGGNVKDISVAKSFYGFAFPAWSPDGKKLVYSEVTADLASAELFVRDVDGQNSKQLTSLTGANTWASWSPDGKQIIFLHREFARPDDAGPLYIMDADGSNQRVLLAKDGAGRAAWRPVTNKAALKPSPDKSQILFVSQRTGNLDIFLMNLDGTGVKNLTNDPGKDEFPCWSPDGKKIAFASDRGGASNIYMMDADGANVKPLTSGPGYRNSPAWSPDGKKILFVESISMQQAHHLCVLDLQNGAKKQIPGSEDSDATDPSWSPDGRKIVFSSHRDGNGGLSVYVMDADGSNAKKIAAADRYIAHPFPAWAPDGTKVAYGGEAAGNMEVFTCDPDGRNKKQLTSLGNVNTFVAWSPDSKHIIFQQLPILREDQPGPVYIMDADGRNQRLLLAKDVPGRVAWRPVGKEAIVKPPSAAHEQPQIQVPGWIEVGPQPERPTKPLPANAAILVGMLTPAQLTKPGLDQINPQPTPPNASGQLDTGNGAILIGMLKPVQEGLAEIDPQPTPPAPIELNAIDESISILFPVFTPNELNGILLPALSQELAASQELQNGVK